MKNLVEAILTKKAEKIQRYPCLSNRASSVGYFVPMLGGCLRRGVYERTSWQEKELHDAKTQLVFDEGNLQERAILRDLADAGIDIIEQQTPFEWKEHQITGHVDGKYVEDGIAFPIEVKSMSPFIFDTVYTIEDFRKKPWTRAYLAQITLYMLMQNVDKAIFILKNKSSGELRQITVDLDYELGEACISACEAINGHIAGSTLPDRISDLVTCRECPFKMVCLPGTDFGQELKIKDDPEFEKKIDRYLDLKPDELECGKIWDGIKAQAKAEVGSAGVLNIMVGKYLLTGKIDAKGTLRIKIDRTDK
jgi:CRISPR/Cas system-associated exonuclease Cas4 (RecB family)